MKESYLNYLSSEHWKEVKRENLTSDSKCILCNSIHRLVLHHKSYENLGRETAKDFIILCFKCHKKIHFVNGRKLSGDAVMERYLKFYAKKRRKELGLNQNKPKPFRCAVRYNKNYYKY